MGKVQISGHTGRIFTINNYNNFSQTIDIYEAFWLDIFSEQKLSNHNLQHKLFHGFSMLLYWVFLPVWKSFLTNPYLTVNIIGALFLLLLWYYGILVIVMKVIGESGNLFGQTLLPEWVELM